MLEMMTISLTCRQFQQLSSVCHSSPPERHIGTKQQPRMPSIQSVRFYKHATDCNQLCDGIKHRSSLNLLPAVSWAFCMYLNFGCWSSIDMRYHLPNILLHRTAVDHCETGTIITCAAFSAATLRADTITTLLNNKAKVDQAAWSIRFTSLSGAVFFIPFERCKSWFVRLNPCNHAASIC